jgi:class 3 adenylate cyclase
MDLGEHGEHGAAVPVLRKRRDGRMPVTLDHRRARVLTTVLFTDVVDSTGHALALGDRHWLALLGRHESMVRRELRHAGGRLVVTIGDGMVATFRGADTAVRCALAITQASRTLGLEMRCGLHCGISERRGPRLGGIVFHVAARIVALAHPGEVLVSGTLTHLAGGCTLHFHERGRRTLHGLPGRWPVYGVTAGATAP